MLIKSTGEGGQLFFLFAFLTMLDCTRFVERHCLGFREQSFCAVCRKSLFRPFEKGREPLCTK